MAKLMTAAAIVGAMLMAPLLGMASAQGGSNAQLNHPSYYEGLGYGSCTKIENPGDPYNLGAAPSGSYNRLLVLKAGSAASNDDWNTLVEYPVTGPYVHPSGKNLSHVIVCTKGGSAPTTTTTTTTTLPGGSCDEYTPTMIAIDPPTAQPGDPITISGVAAPGDTVTATMSGGGGTLGSDVADGSGQFAINAVVPTVNPATYTITLSTTSCPTSVQISFVVYALTFSGCGYNNEGRTFFPGEQVVWTFHDSSFDTNKDVRLRIRKSGFNADLFGYAPWPASNQVTITIPATAPLGQYTMEQYGFNKGNGKSKSKTCPVTIAAPPSPASAVGTGDLQTGGTQLPLAALGIGAVSALAMVQLRVRRLRRS